MDRYYDELEDDLRHLVKKYCRIMGWAVPDVDVQASRELIIQALHRAIDEIESE